MGVGAACIYMYDVVVKKFTFAISSADEFMFSVCDHCLIILIILVIINKKTSIVFII